MILPYYKVYKWYQIILPRLFGTKVKHAYYDENIKMEMIIYRGKIYITKAEKITCQGIDRDLKNDSPSGSRKIK